MKRVLSTLALLPVVIGAIWFLPPIATLLLAEVVALLAFAEYAGIVLRRGVRFSTVVSGMSVVLTCALFGWAGVSINLVMMFTTVIVALIVVVTARHSSDVLRDVSAAVFPLIYLGLPLGAIVAVRVVEGREAVLLLLACVMTSDTAQYYGGRTFGSRALSPTMSPKKTIEGAVFGLAAGILVMVVLGDLWLPSVGLMGHIFLGAAIVGFGLVGDLFESGLKRNAGVKDASGLIPGHGGILDRIDSLLFATPLYYMVILQIG